MTPSPPRIFAWLAAEALRDAVRRRVVLVMAVLSILSLLVIDRCSGCSLQGNVNDVPVDAARISAALAATMLGSLCFWIPLLAGILASEPLARSLSEGSAALWLARPVSRASFAFAQLAGAVGVALLAGWLLLFGAAALLGERQGFPVLAALPLAAISGLNATAIGALAMLASLWIPRAVVALLVLAGMSLVGGLELLSIAGAELDGVAAGIVQLGPPLARGPVQVVSGFVADLPSRIAEASAAALWLRALAWCGASGLLLWQQFQRLEIRAR